MLRQNIARFRQVNFLFDIVLTLAAALAAGETYLILNDASISLPLIHLVTYQQATLIAVIWSMLIFLRSDRYVYRLKTARDFAREAASLVFYGACLFMIGCYLLNLGFMPRIQFVLFLFLDFAVLFLLRLVLLKILHFLRARGFNCQQTLVVGTPDRYKSVVDAIIAQRQWGLKITGILALDSTRVLYRYRDIPVIGDIEKLPETLKTRHIDNVVFSVPATRLNDIREAMLTCEQTGVKMCLQTDFIALPWSRRCSGEFAGKPAIIYSRLPETSVPIAVKSLVDRIAATFGLVLISPVMAMIAALIKASSRGPILFRQERCGLNGKRFCVLKFRTMVADAEELKDSLLSRNEMDGPVFKIRNDPRITRVGKVLRKLSLDELPQLINVVRGEMSLVGPRPPLPSEVQEYDIWQRRKLSMKPGLTCLWQVGKRNDTTFENWMKQDLEYIDNWSLWLDAKVLARTIPTVIKATGR